VNGHIVGIIAVADTLKQYSVGSLKKIERNWVETIMITGDNERTAKAIAEQVGIDTVITNVPCWE
jgi:P-type E1-E2 ATPase